MDLTKAQEVIEKGCEALGLQKEIAVGEIKKGNRWILVFDQVDGAPSVAQNMLKLETWIRLYTREPVELLCESESDKNKRDVRSGREPHTISARGVEKLED